MRRPGPEKYCCGPSGEKHQVAYGRKKSKKIISKTNNPGEHLSFFCELFFHLPDS